MTAGGAVLEVEGLSFGHPGRRLFDAWSARFPAGITLVRGGDGRGKTTLLRLLAGELAPEAGTLRIAGAAARGPAADPRTRVHWVDPRTTAFDASTPIEYFGALRARWPRFDARLLDALIDRFALGPHAGKQLFMLSTGSKRKVWLAGAFASRADVTLIDDPCGALDRPSIRQVTAALVDAAAAADRACVITGYEAPADVPLAAVFDLGD